MQGCQKASNVMVLKTYAVAVFMVMVLGLITVKRSVDVTYKINNGVSDFLEESW